LRKSTLQDEALTKQFPEYLTLRSQLRDIDPDWRPIIPEWDEINTRMLGVAIDAALRESMPAKQALDSAAIQVENLMRLSGYL